jgi:anaerobic magnesium-protoporphyrin IX monomethyl ester cyclase
MSWLKEACGADHFTFADDIFGLKPGWVQRFAEVVAARGMATPFKCLSRADLLSDAAVNALRAAGCQTVWIGAESGSQRVLDAMEKGIRVEQIYGAARRLHAAGIEIGFFLQFGYPGETRADIERTRQMVRECQPDDIGISVSYPLPGTPFYDRVKAELGAKQNWDDSNDLAMMFQGTYTTDFYRQLHRVLHQEFRSRKAAAALRDGLRRPNLLRFAHARHSAMLAYRAVTLPFERRLLDRLAAVPHQSVGPLAPHLTVDAASRPSEEPASGQVKRD